jgi:preprotein translocase subunit SecF
MKIIEKRKLWYLISGAFLALSVVGVFLGGIKPGLDFTGGSRLEVSGVESSEKVKEVLESEGFYVSSVRETAADSVSIKTNPLDEEGHKKIIDSLDKAKKDGSQIKEIQFGTVGATISRDITIKAYLSIGIGLLIIIIYVAMSFKKSSKQLSSWKYGVSAVLAVFHDAIVVIGVFAFLGIFYGVEVDSLFVTAVLTVISFSVHDTIVIFDRIRENLKRSDENFETTVNDSVVEMFGRSLNTSLVIILVILALLLLGGDSIRYFVLAMLIGMVVGTYSSVFIASPILVSWKNFDERRALRDSKK